MSRIRKTAEWELPDIFTLLTLYIQKHDGHDVSTLYSGFDEWLRYKCRMRLTGRTASKVYDCLVMQEKLGFPARKCMVSQEV